MIGGLLLLAPDDDVAMATRALAAGDRVPVPGRGTVTVRSSVQTVSEQLGLGQEEFIPWQLGAVT